MTKKFFILILSALMLTAFSGCGIIIVEDDYSLDKIDGEITCEYRIGEEAKWAEETVDSDVRFDKDMFLRLFNEYRQYDPLTGTKDPMQYDLKIRIDEQPDEWRTIRESEFNIRAVFGDDQRDVSIYRYRSKLYFFVLSIGDRGDPKEEGEYFIELSEEMQAYWRTIIKKVEVSVQ